MILDTESLSVALWLPGSDGERYGFSTISSKDPIILDHKPSKFVEFSFFPEPSGARIDLHDKEFEAMVLDEEQYQKETALLMERSTN